jgi:hypothetical protein
MYAHQHPSRIAEGMQLRYRGRDRGDLEIWLEAIGPD